MAEPKPPVWLDASLVQEALRRGGDDDAVVKSITIRPVGDVGDNYGSVMFRVTAETSSGTKSVICKTPPVVNAIKEMWRKIGLFAQEGIMLAEVIPSIHKLLDEVAPGRFSPIEAKCPFYGEDPDNFIFIDDLALQGFKLADRTRGLGLRHTLLAVRTLARYHAASAVLLKKDPSLQQRLKSLYAYQDPQFANLVRTQFKMTADACKKWPDVPSEVADALIAAKDTAFARYGKIHEPMPGRFNVIIHGDFWLNNMMFRYEEGAVRDIRLVDFQISHVASPTVDLTYFLGATVSEDVSANHLDLVLREYYVALSDTMNLLGQQAPSFEDLMEDFNTNGFYLSFGATAILPFIRSEQLFDVDKSFSGEGEVNSFMFESPKVQRWLRRVLPEYYFKGWLN